MKKILMLLICLLLIFTLIVPVSAGTSIKLMVNGALSPVKALMIDGTTYVPVRFISESLGANVNYKDGIVKISGKETTNTSTSINNSNSLPLKNVGEIVKKGNVSYTVYSISYETKNMKRYAKVTFKEEASVGRFGKLPEFAIESKNNTFKLNDYSITAESSKGSSKPNTDYRRTFTYSFPFEGEIDYVYYYPEGFTKSINPIGRWQKS